MNAEQLIDSIATSLKRRFKGNHMAHEVSQDILAIKDGYMSEEHAGAMIVDLIKTVTEETKNGEIVE